MRRKEHKVAVFGTHRDARYVPSPEGHEVWVINDGWQDRPDYDRLYELHRLEERPWRTEEHLKHLQSPTGEVWTLFPDRIKGAKLFPVAEILGKYPPYFTCSPAWMMAQAIEEGVTHLYLAGLNFSSPKERLLERPCMEFWVGFAMGKGIEVTIPKACPLLKGRGLYGLEDSLHNVHVELRDFVAQAQMSYHSEAERFARCGVYGPDEPSDEDWLATQ